MKKLTGPSLYPFLHNCLSADTDTGSICRIRRFTVRQYDAFRKESLASGTDFCLKADSSANVMFDLVTDSDLLGVSFSMEQTSRSPFASFDLLVDGILWNHRRYTRFSDETLSFDLPAGEHRISLFFPWSAATAIHALFLSDGSHAVPVHKKKRGIAFGDSITQGYAVTHPSMSYVGCVTRELDMELLNQGIGGYCFDQNSLDSGLAVYKPDVILVALGTNDYDIRESLEAYRREAGAYLERLVSIFPDIPVLCLLPIYRDDESFHVMKRIRSYSAENAWNSIAELCLPYQNITVLADSYYPRASDCFAEDMLHPNDLGGVIQGNAVLKRLHEMGF